MSSAHIEYGIDDSLSMCALCCYGPYMSLSALELVLRAAGVLYVILVSTRLSLQQQLSRGDSESCIARENLVNQRSCVYVY